MHALVLLSRCDSFMLTRSLTISSHAVFAIAMESAKQMRVWGDGSTPGESHR